MTSELTLEELDELWKIADAHYSNEEMAAAMGVYEQILARAPTLTPTAEELERWTGLFLVRLMHSRLLLDSGRPSEAIPVARAAALHPKFHLLAHYTIGDCFSELGEHKLAAQSHLQALEPDPIASTLPWTPLSIALDMCGYHEESDFCLYILLQLDPEHEDAHFNLAVSARHQGNYEEAEWRYRRALAGMPEYGTAHAELGRLLLEQGNLNEAEGHLRTAVELEPDEVRTRIYMAQLHWAKDQLEEADRQFQAALDIRPNWTTPHSLYAHFLETALGDDRLAEHHYKKALELDSLNLTALFSAVHFLSKQRRFGGANKFRLRVRTIAEDMMAVALGRGKETE